MKPFRPIPWRRRVTQQARARRRVEQLLRAATAGAAAGAVLDELRAIRSLLEAQLAGGEY